MITPHTPRFPRQTTLITTRGTAMIAALILVCATGLTAVATTASSTNPTGGKATEERQFDALMAASASARQLRRSVDVPEMTTPSERITAHGDGTFTATVSMPTPAPVDDAEPKPMPASVRSSSWLTVIKGQPSSTPNNPGTADGKQALRVGTCPKIIELPNGQAQDGNCGNVTTTRTYFTFPITPLVRPGWPVPTIFDNASVSLTQTRASYCNNHGVTLYASTDVTGKETWPGPAVGAALGTVSSQAGCSPDTPPATVKYDDNVYLHLRNLAANKASDAHFAIRSTVEDDPQGWRRFDSASPTLSYQFAFPPTHAKNLAITPGKQCAGVYYLPALPKGQTHHVTATADDPLGKNIGMDFSIGEPSGKPIQNSPTTWERSGLKHDWATNFTFADKKRYRITAQAKGVRISNKDPKNPQYLKPAGPPPSILVEANTTPPSKPVTVTSEAFPDTDQSGPVEGKPATFTLKADPSDQVVGFTYAWNGVTPVNPHDADCNTSKTFAPDSEGRASGGYIPAVNGTATLPFPVGPITGTVNPGLSKLTVQGFDAAGQTTPSRVYQFYVRPLTGTSD